MPNRKSHISGISSAKRTEEKDKRNQKSMSTSRKKEESNVKHPRYKHELPSDEWKTK